MAVIMERSPLGFRIYMFGENPVASRYSGIRNDGIIIATYMISGLMAGLSGLIMMSRFNSIKVGYGVSYQLLTILVSILGGVAPTGGRGKVLNVVLAVFILQCIASGFNILGFSNYVRNVIYGMVLIIVMIVNFVFPLIKGRRITRKGPIQ
jgi:simple sugar transport system permease protein